MAETDGITQVVLAAKLIAERSRMLMCTSGDTFGLDSLDTAIAALADVADMRICIPLHEKRIA